MNPIRRAGSLIIARKVQDIASNNFFDYKILFLKRASKIKWADVLAYPGGIIEDQDLKFIKSNPSKFPFDLSDRDTLYYHTAKIAALRETYEETGLFFLAENMLRTDTYNTVKDILNYNRQMDQNPQFFDCANMLDMAYNDVICEYSRLVTVPQLPLRYDCQFFLFLASPGNTLNIYKGLEHEKYLNDLDDLNINEDESSAYTWLNPYEILDRTLTKQAKLAPPQFMTANIMLSFPRINDLMQYLRRLKAQGENSIERKDALERNPLTYPFMIGMAKHHNAEYAEKGYRVAGMFNCDREYPLDYFLKFEKDAEWKKELAEKAGDLKDSSRGVCRIYFKDMKEMFDADFDFEIKMGVDFPFQKMLGLEAMKKKLAELSF